MADDELIWAAVAEAVRTIAHLETELDSHKLEKKIRDYFRKGTKGLEFGKKPWQMLINDYADTVFGNMFSGLGERSWFEQADFLLVLDAGIKDNFPTELIDSIPQQSFERTVLAAHDRAFEEQRFLPILWQTTRDLIDGQKSRQKVYNSVEYGRKIACIPAPPTDNEVEGFVGRWIESSIEHLSQATQGEPAWLLSIENAAGLFEALIAGGALPLALREAHGPPPAGWPFIRAAVHNTYLRHGGAAEWTSKKQKKKAAASGDGGAPSEVGGGLRAIAPMNIFGRKPEAPGKPLKPVRGAAYLEKGADDDDDDDDDEFNPEDEPGEGDGGVADYGDVGYGTAPAKKRRRR